MLKEVDCSTFLHLSLVDWSRCLPGANLSAETAAAGNEQMMPSRSIRRHAYGMGARLPMQARVHLLAAAVNVIITTYVTSLPSPLSLVVTASADARAVCECPYIL